jgi:NAD(P)-dependent dehydrogenase (short-subunit alcohol dehydrogenase family)
MLFYVGLWAIVSNAGFNVMGDVELCTINLYKKAMNVNYFGAIRTIRNFLYMVRKNKGEVMACFVTGLINTSYVVSLNLKKIVSQ